MIFFNDAIGTSTLERKKVKNLTSARSYSSKENDHNLVSLQKLLCLLNNIF